MAASRSDAAWQRLAGEAWSGAGGGAASAPHGDPTRAQAGGRSASGPTPRPDGARRRGGQGPRRTPWPVASGRAARPAGHRPTGPSVPQFSLDGVVLPVRKGAWAAAQVLASGTVTRDPVGGEARALSSVACQAQVAAFTRLVPRRLRPASPRRGVPPRRLPRPTLAGGGGAGDLRDRDRGGREGLGTPCPTLQHTTPEEVLAAIHDRQRQSIGVRGGGKPGVVETAWRSPAPPAVRATATRRASSSGTSRPSHGTMTWRFPRRPRAHARP